MKRALALAVLLLGLGPGRGLPATPGEVAVEKAEAEAAEAVALSATQPKEALARARRALGATVQFDPMAFVSAGRKGEVVEDEFQAARSAYRRHRAKLYGAVGEILGKGGDAPAAARYLRRASLLDPTSPRYVALARVLLATGRGPEALTALEKTVGLGGFPVEAVPLVAGAVDAAGWPSAQAEIDRARLRALSVPTGEWRDGPLTFPEKTRLSTNPVFRPDDSPVNVYYAAEASCRTCSEDVDMLRRSVSPGVRVLIVPAGLEGQDHALRQVLGLYRVNWPLVLAPNLAQALQLPPRSILVAARGGWASVLVKAPFLPALQNVLGVFAQTDVAESVPRPGWNRRPIDRKAAAEAPGLLAEGLAPSEEVPAPAELDAAVAAYRAGKPAEALRLFEAVEARGDGQLLPPEARLNRGLCLAALGQRENARILLLKTGDSRFQDAVDRALEKVGSAKR